MSRATTVFIFRNRAVAVCDERGEQMPEWQNRRAGEYESDRAKELCALATEFYAQLYDGNAQLEPEEARKILTGERGWL